jgi:hypothetical protein
MVTFSLATIAVGLCVVAAVWMIGIATWVFMTHARRHVEFEELIDYGSGATLRQVFLYYRSMIFWLGWFFLLFALSVVLLEAAGYVDLFAEGYVGPLGVLTFAFDLALRGAFFDVMEHFKLAVTAVEMNRNNWWFVVYCFVFRMFYSLALFRILMSFAWIYGKIRMVRRERQNFR